MSTGKDKKVLTYFIEKILTEGESSEEREEEEKRARVKLLRTPREPLNFATCQHYAWSEDKEYSKITLGRYESAGEGTQKEWHVEGPVRTRGMHVLFLRERK
jgi:hypothetical protein